MNGQDGLGLPILDSRMQLCESLQLLLSCMSDINADRVVSISASQSLRATSASDAAGGAISTGLPRLDEAICPASEGEFSGLASDSVSTGIPRGQVAEVFGPPGVGKSSLA